MATLSFSWEVTAANLTRIIDGIAYQHNYQDEIEDPAKPGETIPNPKTKAEYADEMAWRWVKENVKAYEANQAADTARTTAIDAVETEVTKT